MKQNSSQKKMSSKAGRRRKTNGCPRHGFEHMIRDGASYYCGAPTPGELTKKCFYHPSNHPSENKALQKRKREEAKGKPNLWKVILDEWARHKKNRVNNLEKQRAKAREKKLLAYN